ncbi:MAG: 50S ribosomal protein L29 [Bacillati bacterium ANGP1]|uniref:Large ribosomal subunit protein uL29 n=1 Tax=Candidatus Segetimicrobium genomatis TaxID=2569760 RepID=A0A537LJN2_9BACT|nr:MAG: 50S ribosomal protein L29 [Terrabacteria group bacterium ANGP1]TMJ09084.1 MAG: 50S ribosomal protein L29 [Terrabacteria group bacterium ANGP1]HTE04009.1 50S ribosomal protein L29 [bacterium]
MPLEAREIRELTPDELLRKLDEAQRELFTLRLKVSGQTPNTAKIRGLRRDVARLKTVLTEKGVRV